MAEIKALLVDDEESFRNALGKRLTRRGMTVAQAGSGEEALERLEAFQPDVILLDVKMPGMDGLTALHKIKEAQPLVEVVMLTGHASMEIAIRGMELGAFDYLMKPVEFEELLYKLEDASNRKRHHEERIAARSHSS
ncbi:MAG: response regulator [Pseudodesulfovibrio sp.]|jgi:DNA-binding NtrC family response regulator|uniref:Response regulator receiver domain-containing protein n=1 Tax=Pseudodesulfovibrio indicus TaxID=1716143 RepID=A0A126QRN2_9BACT|nr:response regulator [Pseudodesulfovibrio indicus]AMK12634.1 two-component system response regulator [Pseudodesulfovibrio indicus]TDT90946.1 response regulator receiver domain-containing protein [Pseudodesulfovibrio indicus]